MTENLNDLVSDVVINEQIVHIRPITSDDIEIKKRFVEHLSPESRYFRFLGGTQDLTDDAARVLCDIDFDKRMAFIAVIKSADAKEEVIGVSRYASDKYDHCESAVTVADDWQNHGLGQVLMGRLIDFARHKRKERIYLIALTENTHMRMLARDLGMDSQREPEDAKLMRHELVL